MVDEEGLNEAIRRRSSDKLIYQPRVLKVDVFMRGERFLMTANSRVDFG
jgi:hypothetical protein